MGRARAKQELNWRKETTSWKIIWRAAAKDVVALFTGNSGHEILKPGNVYGKWKVNIKTIGEERKKLYQTRHVYQSRWIVYHQSMKSISAKWVEPRTKTMMITKKNKKKNRSDLSSTATIAHNFLDARNFFFLLRFETWHHFHAGIINLMRFFLAKQNFSLSFSKRFFFV